MQNKTTKKKNNKIKQENKFKQKSKINYETQKESKETQKVIK